MQLMESLKGERNERISYAHHGIVDISQLLQQAKSHGADIAQLSEEEALLVEANLNKLSQHVLEKQAR
jgi:cell division protein FtsB